ncbi:MAG: RNA-binding protein [Nanoarchaeota archaeon]|nr:RNA-binding protein [Nanoarchaeota archaeon]
MKSKKHLKNKEVRELIDKIRINFQVEDIVNKKDTVELADEKIILVNKEPMFFYIDSLLIPTLKAIVKNNFLKKITVDMGAVKFVVKGADIMRPGVVDVDEGIEINDIVSIVDINNKKPLAVGKALLSGEDILALEKGIVVKNLHQVGDAIWNFF